MSFDPSIPADNIKIRYLATAMRQQFQALLDTVTARTPPPFPSGTRLFFHQDTAPIGWTTDTTIGDSLLAIKRDGTSSYTTGGTVQGSWQQSDHVLSVDEMPNHNHYISPMSQVGGVRGGGGDVVAYATGFPAGSAGPYNVSGTGSSQAHNHGNYWRPQAAVGIIASKD